MASLMWNHSLCPGCRLLNKQIGTTQREACEGLWHDRCGDCMAWPPVGQRLRIDTPSLPRGPEGLQSDGPSLPAHAPGPFLPMPAAWLTLQGWDRPGIKGVLVVLLGSEVTVCRTQSWLFRGQQSALGFGLLSPSVFTPQRGTSPLLGGPHLDYPLSREAVSF